MILNPWKARIADLEATLEGVRTELDIADEALGQWQDRVRALESAVVPDPKVTRDRLVNKYKQQAEVARDRADKVEQLISDSAKAQVLDKALQALADELVGTVNWNQILGL